MRRATITTFVSLVVAGILFTAAVASAHATGASWEIPIGIYTADVGYDPVTFTAGQYTRFDFALWIGKTTTDSNGITGGTPASFAQVLVRVLEQPDQDTLFATKIWTQPIGPTTLLYEFVEPGTYSLEVSFLDAQGKDIAVHSFPITVLPSDSSGLTGYAIDALLFLLGCGLGTAAVFFIRKRVF